MRSGGGEYEDVEAGGRGSPPLHYVCTLKQSIHEGEGAGGRDAVNIAFVNIF